MMMKVEQVSYYALPNLYSQRVTAQKLAAQKRMEDDKSKHLRIIETISRYYDMPLALVSSKIRKREVVFVRQLMMAVMARQTNLTLLVIGKHFGNRDHTTVIHARTVIQDYLDTEYRSDEIRYFMELEY